MMRFCRLLSERHDRSERQPVGPSPAQRLLEVERHLSLRHAHGQDVQDVIERPICARLRLAEHLQLVLILDPAQPSDRVTDRHELHIG